MANVNSTCKYVVDIIFVWIIMKRVCIIYVVDRIKKVWRCKLSAKFPGKHFVTNILKERFVAKTVEG